jgi:hypothetical protein
MLRPANLVDGFAANNRALHASGLKPAETRFLVDSLSAFERSVSISSR